MRRRLVSTLLAASALALLPRAARAEAPNGGIALDSLRPSPAGDTFVAVPSPFAVGHLVPRFTALFACASRPLVLARSGGDTAVVSAQGVVHLGATLALWDRLLVGAQMPIALIQSGESPSVTTGQKVTFSSPRGAQAGDLRLDLRVRLFGEDGGPFQLGTGASIHVPTAPRDSFAGEGAVRLEPDLLLGGRVRAFVWSAAAGALFRASDNPALFTWGAGAGVVLGDERVRVGAEVMGATPLQDRGLVVGKVPVGSWGTSSNAEVLADVRLRLVRDLHLGVAGGPGLSRAIGTPTFRVLGALTWSPRAASVATRATDPDTDGDGLADAKDRCPHAFGDTASGGCPVLDGDEDGVADSEDACPKDAGVKSGDRTKNGCPADRDGDGVPDLLDVCPDQKGSAAQHGCAAPGGK